MRSRNKAQVLYYDMILAIVIVMIVSVFYVSYISDRANVNKSMLSKTQTISGLLMSQGYPAQWNASNVKVPGFVVDYKINSTQLELLYGIPYPKLTTLFQTEDNLYIYVEQDSSEIIVGGLNETGRAPTALAKNIAHVQRIALYEEKPAKIHIIQWS